MHISLSAIIKYVDKQYEDTKDKTTFDVKQVVKTFFEKYAKYVPFVKLLNNTINAIIHLSLSKETPTLKNYNILMYLSIIDASFEYINPNTIHQILFNKLIEHFSTHTIYGEWLFKTLEMLDTHCIKIIPDLKNNKFTCLEAFIQYHLSNEYLYHMILIYLKFISLNSKIFVKPMKLFSSQIFELYESNRFNLNETIEILKSMFCKSCDETEINDIGLRNELLHKLKQILDIIINNELKTREVCKIEMFITNVENISKTRDVCKDEMFIDNIENISKIINSQKLHNKAVP